MTQPTLLTSHEALLERLAVEEAGLTAVVASFSDAAWREKFRPDGWNAHDIVAHLADANYGLALMTLGELKPSMPINNETGWMDIDDYNQQRREKNAGLPRDKVVTRLGTSFEHARRAIQGTDDLNAPGPYGPIHSKLQWLNRIVWHSHMHRIELEELAAQE